jgi:hypothetical protein
VQTTDDQTSDVSSDEKETRDKDQETLDKEIIALAKERFKTALEASEDVRKLAKEDLRFSNGEQWSQADLKSRAEDGRPCLTINRIPQFVRQIANDIRQNRPAIKVSPVDNKADIETARVLQGMIRHIEYSSNADTAYDTASDFAARSGFGYFRIITGYADPMAFDQDIMIKRIPDPMVVHFDPASREPDGSDATYAFIEELIPISAFKAEYPDSEISTSSDFAALEAASDDWITKAHVRVVEYFTKEYRDATIVRLSDGSVVEAEDLPLIADAMSGQDIRVVDERPTKIPVIKWFKLNGCDVLERTEFPGQFIPIIPVYGEEIIIDGKRVLSGVVRHAMDSQRAYNYMVSSEMEQIALAPRAPFIGAKGQFETFEKQWRLANKKNVPFLEYNAKVGAQVYGPPQRNAFEPAVQAITQGRQLAAEDLKATTGIYDAALGARSNEQSGVAIQRRANQAQTSNFHFADNLSKSIRHAGRILVSIIPKIYDTARAIRILGEDGSEDIVTINAMFEKDGRKEHYRLGAGRYDVTVSSGPSFETKRQEAVESMMALVQSYPPLMQVAGDLLVKNMDWNQSQEIADRIKRTLPPNLQDDGKDQQQLPPQAQAQMQKMGQTIEALTKELQSRTQQMETKQAELDSKERIEKMKLEAQINIERMKLGSVQAETLLNYEVSRIENELDRQHASELAETQAQRAQPTQDQMPTGGLTPGNSIPGEYP